MSAKFVMTMSGLRSVVVGLVVLGLVGLPTARAYASGSIPAPSGLTSTDVSFTGFGGLSLHGTVLAPANTTGTPRPGVVLVTGSGSGTPREHLLTEAIEFARQGVAALIYDKRSVGYTLFRRSYSELATDTLAAINALRAQPGVDPAKVGVWGSARAAGSHRWLRPGPARWRS